MQRKAAASPIATTTAIPGQSIAVLPFENLSADIGSFKVISRTSTQACGSHPENLTLVGQQPGVATLLEGSVQKAGNEMGRYPPLQA